MGNFQFNNGAFDSGAFDPDFAKMAAEAIAGGGGKGPNLLQSLSGAINGPLGAGFLMDAFGGIIKSVFGGTGTDDVKKAEAGYVSELGTEIVDPAKAAGFASSAVLRKGKGMGNVLSKRFGPEAKGELYSQQLGEIAGIYGDAYSTNSIAKKQRDLMVRKSLLNSAHMRRM